MADDLSELRTKRLFVATLESAFGLTDQSYSYEDGVAINPSGQYTVYGSQGGGYAVEGRATALNQQQGAMPLLILAAIGLVVWALK